MALALVDVVALSADGAASGNSTKARRDSACLATSVWHKVQFWT